MYTLTTTYDLLGFLWNAVRRVLFEAKYTAVSFFQGQYILAFAMSSNFVHSTCSNDTQQSALDPRYDDCVNFLDDLYVFSVMTPLYPKAFSKTKSSINRLVCLRDYTRERRHVYVIRCLIVKE